MAATKPPSARDPVSPINTLAGYTLKSTKSHQRPYHRAGNGSIPLFMPTATTVKNTATSTVTEEARPSRPSVKFTPFTVPMTTIYRKGTASQPRSRYSAGKGDQHGQRYIGIVEQIVAK